MNARLPLLLIATYIIVLISCKEEEASPDSSYNIDLTKNELFEYSVPNGIEDAASIFQKGAHFLICEIAGAGSTFELLFRYKPEVDYVGKDTVILYLSSGPPSTYSAYKTFYFNIHE